MSQVQNKMIEWAKMSKNFWWKVETGWRRRETHLPKQLIRNQMVLFIRSMFYKFFVSLMFFSLSSHWTLFLVFVFMLCINDICIYRNVISKCVFFFVSHYECNRRNRYALDVNTNSLRNLQRKNNSILFEKSLFFLSLSRYFGIACQKHEDEEKKNSV